MPESGRVRRRQLEGEGPRVFVSLFDEAFEVFDDDVGRLPPTPTRLEEGNVEAMDDGTLVVVEPCGTGAWRWQPEEN